MRGRESVASAGEGIGRGHTEELVEVVYARGEREHDDVHDEERDWLDQPWFASRVGVDVPCAAIFFFPTEESMFECKVKNEWVNE